MSKRRVLVAPLNWGMGHATRCIPLIRELTRHDFEPVIATDGQAQLLLKKEFPHYRHFTLPSYNVTYSRKGSLLKWKLLAQTPKIIKAIRQEHQVSQKLVQQERIIGIISDNRYGVRNSNVPSVFITHQLNVRSGSTSFLTSKLQQKLIGRFDQCWVPDVAEKDNLSGLLGHMEESGINVKYIGPLSRLEKSLTPMKYDLTVLLSGPEPQRSQLESKLGKELQSFSGKILFIRGVLTDQPAEQQLPNALYYNYLVGNKLEIALNSSKIVLARSGYSTVMDLAKLEKKAFFIPTPGQPEQEYLARRMERLQIAPMSHQNDFSLDRLSLAEQYQGLRLPAFTTDFRSLFSLFNGK